MFGKMNVIQGLKTIARMGVVSIPVCGEHVW